MVSVSNIAFVIQPTSNTICSGGNVNFNITASGTGLNYQWYYNSGTGWNPVADGGASPTYSGAGTNSLSITGIPIGMNGYQYQCVISDGTCSLTSNAAILTVISSPPLTINSSPTPNNVCEASNTTFSVPASSGTSFQWQVSTTVAAGPYTPINAATIPPIYSNYNTPTLVLTNVPLSVNNYWYRCSVTACGTPRNSTASQIRVRANPSITTQPASAAICEGSNNTFITIGTLIGGVTYQWQINTGIGFNNIPGQTTNTLALTGITSAMNGYQYQCVVDRLSQPPSCPVTSNIATLTVNTPPVITVQPVSQTVCSGSLVIFNVTASGSPSPTYQWRKDGVNISGATGTTYSINPASASDVGNYSVVITNSCGSVTSANASLALYPALIPGAHNTTPLTVCTGYYPAELTFTTAPSGGNPTYFYQWQSAPSVSGPWTNIAGETTSTYQPPTLSAAGIYCYRCTVYDLCGTIVYTSPKEITVVNDPTATLSGATVCPNDPVTLTPVVTGGTGSFTYQWWSCTSYSGTYTIIPGATNASYSPPTTITGTLYYQVVISANGAACNNPVCPPVAVIVQALPPAPTLTPSPVCAGTAPTFTAGNGSIYEFFLNGVSQGAPSATNTYTPAAVLAGGDQVCVESSSPVIFDGNIYSSEWGTPLATSIGGPAGSSFGSANNLSALNILSSQDYIFCGIAGSLNSTNRILLFIDCQPGGYNSLSGWTNRTGGYPNGTPYHAMENLNSGITFDPGFEPDYILGINDVAGTDTYFDLYNMQANTQLFIGSANTSSLIGYAANSGVNDNSKGFEFAIPRAALGNPTGTIKVFTMITNEPGFSGNYTLLSNQFLTHAEPGANDYGMGGVTFGAALPDPVSVPLSGTNCSSQTCITVQPLPSTSAIWHQ